MTLYSIIYGLLCSRIHLSLISHFTAALPEFLKHLSSSLFGYLSTFIFFTNGNAYVCILVFISYGCLKFIQIIGIGVKRQGFVMIGVQIITIFTWLVHN